jgi:glutamine synthetase
MDAKDLLARVKEDQVKFISLQFSDVTGRLKSVDMPVKGLEGALEDGVWFDGSSVEGFANIEGSDMLLQLDPESYALLPWTAPELRRARIFCDILDGQEKPFQGDPRGNLKRALAKLDERGWFYNVGPEPEFLLFKGRKEGSIHPKPHDEGSYFEFAPFEEPATVRNDMMETLRIMGIEVEVGHHEVALGQHEIDFRFAHALKTADNVYTLKSAVKAIAAKHGLIASFMPKPVFGINGSGMHCHQSLFDTKSGSNVFFDLNDEAHLSKTAYSFIAGQLAHARALAAILAPTVNSYKRLVPGYEAPVYIGWARQNRSALIRIPRYTEGRDKAVRAELRFPDPSCNPYLAFTVMLAAALDGIDKKLEAPKPLNNINLYHLDAKERKKLGVKELPGSLAEALGELEKDEVLKSALGEVMYDAFVTAKRKEWDEFRLSVSDYEIERYLETA